MSVPEVTDLTPTARGWWHKDRRRSRAALGVRVIRKASVSGWSDTL